MADRQTVVMIADPQILFAEALGRSLRQFRGISVLPEHPSTGLSTAEFVEMLRPDVLLLEFWMGGMLAPAVVRATKDKVPECKVIVLSWLHGRREILNALYAGAVAFLPKTVSVQEVADTVRRSQSEGPPTGSERLSELLATLGRRDEESYAVWEKMKALNRRELQILTMISVARPLPEIASSLSLSPRTVRNYLDNMLKKTGARSQLELLALARDCGLIGG